MENKYLDMNTLQYQLFELHSIENLFGYERFKEYNKESIQMLLDSVKSYCDKDAYPFLRIMDTHPARYEDGKIITHPCVKQSIKMVSSLGLIGGTFDHKDGGLQLPDTIHQAAYYIIDAANNHVSGYPGLTSGAAKLIVSFGEDDLKKTYVPKMQEGAWSGTMCLTEPQAGSSLSDITTTAVSTKEGYYDISGQKIFISGGDHEHSENFVHLVLARIKGAPAGTRGISLFVVPKLRLTSDGGLENNDVLTVADFQKLGQRGYATTHLAFGDRQNCRGWLLGAPHEGLRYMFQMMNGARISVGRHGASIASAAYYASLQYANERPQGRRLSDGGKKDVSKEQILINNHPDIRRMLLFQKAISEGALSLVLQASLYQDMQKVTTGEESKKYATLLEILTPIVKTYPSEKGKEAVDTGLQVLGGYGFCTDFVLQQYYRDIRIMSIYEGTTGIQSLDLLGRKMTMDDGAAMRLLELEIKIVIEEAQAYNELKFYALILSEQLALNKKVLDFLMPFAAQGDYERFLADATIFMDFFGTIVLAWQWLKIANSAKRILLIGTGTQQKAFYESKIHTMKFFYKYEVSRTIGLANTLMSKDVLTIMNEEEMIL